MITERGEGHTGNFQHRIDKHAVLVSTGRLFKDFELPENMIYFFNDICVHCKGHVIRLSDYLVQIYNEYFTWCDYLIFFINKYQDKAHFISVK